MRRKEQGNRGFFFSLFWGLERCYTVCQDPLGITVFSRIMDIELTLDKTSISRGYFHLACYKAVCLVLGGKICLQLTTIKIWIEERGERVEIGGGEGRAMDSSE